MKYNLSDIRKVYNQQCEKYHCEKVNVDWMGESYLHYETADGVYFDWKNQIYLKKNIETKILGHYNQAYHNLELYYWEYVVYHELFHHISQEDDNPEFEIELEKYIKNEFIQKNKNRYYGFRKFIS